MVLALKDTADFKIPTKNIVDNDSSFNYSTANSINAYDRTYLDIINANRTKFFPYGKVLIERSTDSGSTWTTVSTSDFSNENRGNLMSDVGTSLYIGVGNAALTQQLRVTLQFPGTAYYCSLDRAFFRFSNSGHACSVTIEASTYGAQSTYTTLASNQTVAGWSGNNMVKFSERSAWGTNNSNHLYNIRFIFKYTSINSSLPTNQGSIQKIDMFGQNFWGTSNSPQHYGHLYSWDYLKNVTFPATLTATTLKTGTAAADHLLARRIRGDNNGTTYYHAIDMGYTNHDRCDFYEYGGVWNFWRNQSSAATTDTNNLALGITLDNVKNKSYTYTWPNKSGTFALTSDVPTVNDATLTIQKNGTDVQTFTANQSTNATANITVPTSFSDLTGTISNSQLDWSTLCAPVAETNTTTMAISYTKFYEVSVFVRSAFGGHGFEMGGMLDLGGTSGGATVNKTAVTGLSGYYGFKTSATVPMAPNSSMVYEWSGIVNSWTPGAGNGGDRWYGNAPTGFAVDTDGYIWLGVNKNSTTYINSWVREQYRYATAAHFIDH